MPNVIGPDWGKQVADILMQGGQWKQTKELQESAQEDRAKSIALEAGMKLLESMGKSGKEVTPELAQYATDLMGAFSAAMGIETTPEMNAEMASMFTTPQTELARKTLPEKEKQIGLQTAGMEQGLEAGAVDLLTKKEELDYLPKLMESRLTYEGQRGAVLEAQPEAIRASAAASRATADATTKGIELIEPRRKLLEATARKYEQDAVLMEAQLKALEAGSDPNEWKKLNDTARVVLSLGKEKGGTYSRAAVDAVMLMYEQAGVPLPWTVEGVIETPGFWAKLLGKMPMMDTPQAGLKRVTNYSEIIGILNDPTMIQESGEQEAAGGMFNPEGIRE